MSSRTTSVACLSAAISTILLASSTGLSDALPVFQPPLVPHSETMSHELTAGSSQLGDTQDPGNILLHRLDTTPHHILYEPLRSASRENSLTSAAASW